VTPLPTEFSSEEEETLKKKRGREEGTTPPSRNRANAFGAVAASKEKENTESWRHDLGKKD